MGSVNKTLGEESFAMLSSEDVASLAADFAGEIVRPVDPGYDDAREIWNGMIDRYPALVARCSGVADVVAAVNFAREQGLEVAVRGGGHNVAGTAVNDGGIVVDLSEMTAVRVDREAETVRAEGGATLGDVDRETQLFGLATALGAVSQTGIAGLTLNGGYGHCSREYGLALDNLVSVDVVTADGRVRTASRERNADLFWGLRGGGGALGIVTSFEYELHEVGPEVDALFTWFRADEVFGSLLEGVTPLVDLSGEMAYVDLQSMLDEDYPDGLRYYWKAIYLEELDDAIVDLMLEYNESAPSELSTLDLWHLDGAVADVPRDETAFWHRDKSHMLTVEANWEDPDADDANLEWAREAITETETLSVASGRYGNFPGLYEEPARARYGDNYDRMVDLKTEYDPENLFRLPGNVEPRVDD
ncbi:FAD-binding oxidoreductase [Natronococcus sp.]|uniref:FAD-binding oxidoreductase n=1 Tax=Natronococcus sp. TaxID=35747 RepID=UPI0025D98BBC|nr:FAD-binding oxidoreductase [Natronococcus sp.]